MIKLEDVYKIGRLGKPHGVKGEISFMFDDDVFDRVEADYLILDIDGILVPFFMEEYRFKGSETALVKFEDIDDESQLQELVGCNVYFPRDLSDGDEDNITWAEIIGYKVIDSTDGSKIGRLKAVDDSTINTLFEIETDDGREVLVPANDDLINNVDIKNKEISIELPEGLLDLD